MIRTACCLTLAALGLLEPQARGRFDRDDPESARALVARAAEWHDPFLEWPHFAFRLFIQDRLADMQREIRLDLNVPARSMVYDLRDNEIHVRQILENGHCDYMVGGALEHSPELDKRHERFCEETRRLRDRYELILGMPMKLLEPDVVIQEDVEEVQLLRRRMLRVEAVLPDSDKSWRFYFSPFAYRLKAFEYFGEDDQDGELIVYDRAFKVGRGLRLPESVHIYRLQDEERYAVLRILDHEPLR